MVFQRHRKYLFENINQLCGLKPRYLNKSTVFLLRKSKSSIHLELCVDHVDVTWHRHVLFTFSVKLAREKKHAYNARGRGEGISAGDSDFNCTPYCYEQLPEVPEFNDPCHKPAGYQCSRLKLW